MGKETLTQLQEAQGVPYRISPRRNTERHMFITVTTVKDREKIFTATREKQQITHKGTPYHYQLILR